MIALQVKDLKSRKVTGESDEVLNLVRLSKEYPSMKLLQVCPRLLMVQCEPEVLDYVRNLLKNISWEDGGCVQQASELCRFFFIFTLRKNMPAMLLRPLKFLGKIKCEVEK